MPALSHDMKNRYFTREVLAAWVVAAVAVAIGLLALVLHEPDTDDRMVPRAFAPPVASARQPDDGVFVRNRTGWDRQQSGSSTAPDTPPEHR